MDEARIEVVRGDRLADRGLGPPATRAPAPRPLAEIEAELAALAERRPRRLIINGGVPQRHPEIAAIVRACRSIGAEALVLETSAASLADPRADAVLADAGVDELLLWIGGLSDAAHRAALLERDAADLARAALLRGGLPRYAVASLRRQNLAELAPLARLLVAEGAAVRGMLLAPPALPDDVVAARRAVPPPAAQAEAAAAVFAALRAGRRGYGFLSTRGLPVCAGGEALEPFATVLHDRITWHKRSPEAAAERWVRHAGCATCALRQRCPGVEARSLAVFGAAGFAPVPLDRASGWKLRRINETRPQHLRTASPYENQGDHQRKALVRLNGHCNMSCSFCFIDRTVGDSARQEVERELDALRAAGYQHLTFSGGEPTLHPALPELIAYAKALGFHPIELQSNGVRAADPRYAARLVEAGLTEVCFSLHHHEASVSDEITRLPGGFAKTLQAMQNFLDLKVYTMVAHVLTELNYRTAEAFIGFLDQTLVRRPRQLSVCFGYVQPISDLVFDWVIPRFRDAAPHLRAALARCEAAGIGHGGLIGQGGFPPCLLGGELRYHRSGYGDIFRSPEVDREFYKAPRCVECSFDPWCVGVRRSYVEQFDDSELRPFRAAPALLPER